MVESAAENLEAYAESGPLDIAEGFPQGMGTIVAGQVDSSAP